MLNRHYNHIVFDLIVMQLHTITLNIINQNEV